VENNKMANVNDADARLIETVIKNHLKAPGVTGWDGAGEKIIRALRRKGWRKPVRKLRSRHYLAVVRTK
jgi:hypothetical protein